jgi:hypothetical protein
MLEDTRKNILWILRESKEAIKKENTRHLSDLSNHTIHDASVLQDPSSIQIAILVYSLFKIFERKTKYKSYKDWPIFYRILNKNLTDAIFFLSKKNFRNYEAAIRNILKGVDKLESHLKSYIKEVIEKAKISKGSRVYEHGISIGRTAELLGISGWELMEYTGKTGISEVKYNLTMDINERLKLVRSIFK